MYMKIYEGYWTIELDEVETSASAHSTWPYDLREDER